MYLDIGSNIHLIGLDRLPFRPEGYNFRTWRGHKIHYVIQGEGFLIVNVQKKKLFQLLLFMALIFPHTNQPAKRSQHWPVNVLSLCLLESMECNLSHVLTRKLRRLSSGATKRMM